MISTFVYLLFWNDQISIVEIPIQLGPQMTLYISGQHGTMVENPSTRVKA